jgi:predicted  nucleic acid-binding Zn-ribbon protein
MSRLGLLAELQAIDMRIAENSRAKREVHERLDDDVELVTAQQTVDAAVLHANEIRARLRSLELEVNGIIDKIKTVDARLYDGRITSPKELTGLEQDELMLKRRKTEVEDQMLEAMSQQETTEAALTGHRAALERISAFRSTSTARDQAALEVLKSTADKLNQAREQLCVQIAPGDLAMYETLRHDKKGRALSRMKGTACETCGFSVPSGLASRARVGQELTFCPNCGRILVP